MVDNFTERHWIVHFVIVCGMLIIYTNFEKIVCGKSGQSGLSGIGQEPSQDKQSTCVQGGDEHSEACYMWGDRWSN